MVDLEAGLYIYMRLPISSPPHITLYLADIFNSLLHSFIGSYLIVGLY